MFTVLKKLVSSLHGFEQADVNVAEDKRLCGKKAQDLNLAPATKSEFMQLCSMC